MALITDFEAPIAGESLTKKPNNYSYDRPPQYTDPEEVLDWIFKRMTQPRMAEHLLAAMDAGIPLTLIVKQVSTTGFVEGKWSAPMVPLIAAPLTAMLLRMAEAAGIDPVISIDTPEKIPEIMIRMGQADVGLGQVQRAQKAVKVSAKELKKEIPQELRGKPGLLIPKGL